MAYCITPITWSIRMDLELRLQALLTQRSPYGACPGSGLVFVGQQVAAVGTPEHPAEDGRLRSRIAFCSLRCSSFDRISSRRRRRSNP